MNIPRLVGREDVTTFVESYDWQSFLEPYFILDAGQNCPSDYQQIEATTLAVPSRWLMTILADTKDKAPQCETEEDSQWTFPAPPDERKELFINYFALAQH